MELQRLINKCLELGCQNIYVKRLSPNDNSKNQVYFGGGFEVLNVFPTGEIYPDGSGEWVRDRFKANVDFAWLDDDGNLNQAPKAQFILYPKYPEVRFSGFLQNCNNAPSNLMASRMPGRLLFLSILPSKKVIGYVTSSDSELAIQFSNKQVDETFGIFDVLNISLRIESKAILLAELRRIHELGWIKSKKLDSRNNVVDCDADQCGGYTLEAELGITPNGKSEPDFLGWEIKQFGVKNFSNINSSKITLMTPEPTGGAYREKGVDYFLNNYGYQDTKGREGRLNFGGIYKVGAINKRTNLEIELMGYNPKTELIENVDGMIILKDPNGVEAASWTFSSLINHWVKKHNKACYVPSVCDKTQERHYRYGRNVVLGEGTDFHFFLKQMHLGNIYYDPAVKKELVKGVYKEKRRSQFRVKSGFISALYNKNEIKNLLDSV